MTYKEKTGVYIFLDNDNIPVYVGVAGKVGGDHDIKQRLQKQFNCDNTNATLSINIEEIESILQSIQINCPKKKDKKELILKYASKLLVIEVGDISSADEVQKAQSLEILLIALFNAKYNK